MSANRDGLGRMAEEKLNRNGDKRGMSPNSRNNLDKRNLRGNNHAKGLTITSAIRKMLDLPAEQRWLDPGDYEKGLTWRDAIAKRMVIEAARGNAKIGAEILDRLEGKVTQPVAAEGEIVLRVKYDNSD